MTTAARAQVREAVARFDSMGPNLYTQKIADAASDIWEPLLRDLHAVVRSGCLANGENLMVIRRVEEALGEAS